MTTLRTSGKLHEFILHLGLFKILLLDLETLTNSK